MDSLEERRIAELKQAQSVIDGAKSAGRQMNDDERAQCGTHIKAAEDLLAQIKDAAEDGRLREALGSALKGYEELDDNGAQRPKFKSVGEAFVKSTAYTQAVTALREGSRFSTAAIDTGIGYKALTSGGVTRGVGDTQDLPGIVTKPIFRPVVADLLATGTMTGTTLSYLIESAYTNAAAATAESGAKPPSDLTLQRVDGVLSKIATLLDVPDEFLLDLQAAQSYIDGRLTLFIQLAEEQEILSGSGTAPHVRGILNVSGIQTQLGLSKADNLDAIYRAITQVRVTALLEPDGIVVNPTDYQQMRLAKDTAQQYFGGGPFGGAYGEYPGGPVGGGVGDPPVWGLRTVITPAIAAGTALLGAFQTGAMLFRKGGIVVDSTNSDGTKFTLNVSTIRAEERVALAVFRPSAFVKITMGTT
jgi:HK97 family phage major capsid protein